MNGKSGLEAELRGIVDKLGGKATISQIQERMSRKTSYQNVRKALERLVERGEVIRDDWSNPPEVNYLLTAVPLERWFKGPSDTQAIEDLEVEREKQGGFLLDIVRKELVSVDPEQLQKVFGQAAQRLIAEDPRELYVRFAQWLCDEHRKAVETYRKSQSNAEGENLIGRIEKLADIAKAIYLYQFGVPMGKEKSVFRLHFTRKKPQDDQSFLDITLLHAHLSRVIHGKTFIEKFSAERPAGSYFEASTDASQQEFSLGEILPRIFEAHPMAIIAAVSTYYDLYENKLVNFDAKPDPSTWATYTSNEARQLGILVPPDAWLQLDDPRRWERTVSAAMNVRQYIKDHETLAGNPGHPVHILFRDGRIYPLEHLFSDYHQGRIHGEMVRNSLRQFSNVLKDIEYSNRTLYCGVVKRATVEVIAPMVFWYLKYGSAKGGSIIWKEMDEELIFGFRMSDQRTALALFECLTPDLKPGEFAVISRFIRHFWFMSEISNEISEAGLGIDSSEEEWLEFIGRLIEAKDLTFDLEPDTYALLCARAAVLSFYCSLPKRQVSPFGLDAGGLAIPRYEVLVPYGLLRDPKKLGTKEHQYVTRVLEALSDARTLNIYPESIYKYDSVRPLVPWAVCLSHEYVKDTTRLYKEDFRGYILKLAVAVARDELSKRHGGKHAA